MSDGRTSSRLEALGSSERNLLHLDWLTGTICVCDRTSFPPVMKTLVPGGRLYKFIHKTRNETVRTLLVT